MTRKETRRRMIALVRRWDTSGETQAVFARRQGVSYAALRYWRARVHRQPATGATAAFTPVQVVDTAGRDTGAIEITLATGDRLVVRAGVSDEVLRSVLVALRSPC